MYVSSITLVFAGGRPISNFLFFLIGFRLPPVALRLCQLSRDIPINTDCHDPVREPSVPSK